MSLSNVPRWLLVWGLLFVVGCLYAAAVAPASARQSVTRVYSDGSAVCYSDGRNLSCVPN
jgi:hypothetical protein